MLVGCTVKVLKYLPENETWMLQIMRSKISNQTQIPFWIMLSLFDQERKIRLVLQITFEWILRLHIAFCEHLKFGSRSLTYSSSPVHGVNDCRIVSLVFYSLAQTSLKKKNQNWNALYGGPHCLPLRHFAVSFAPVAPVSFAPFAPVC